MKNLKKKSLAAILAIAMLVTALIGTSVYAAEDYKNVAAQLSPHFTILIDGVEREFYNVQGQEVHPILYNGTTYLPLRAIGELMDKNVNWDQSTKTATLSGSRGGSVTRGTEDKDASRKNVAATLRYDFTIVIDGEKQTFKDVNGKTVYPLLYEGSTYLPLRAIGNLMGKTVSWDGETYTASLIGGEGSLVTDADSFGQSGVSAPDGLISKKKAKEIALDHAGVSQSKASFVRVELDYDDGRWEYEVEFYSGNTEYDYEINAKTGKIVSYDHDIENFSPSQGTGDLISRDEAKEIALDHAGVSQSKASFVRVELDYDDGVWEYEVEFYSGNTEYDYEINAATGKIISVDHDAEYYTPSTGSLISRDKAKEIALDRAGVSSGDVSGFECELDEDDGRWEYEIEFRCGGYEYEIKVDAQSGKVLDYERDWD